MTTMVHIPSMLSLAQQCLWNDTFLQPDVIVMDLESDLTYGRLYVRVNVLPVMTYICLVASHHYSNKHITGSNCIHSSHILCPAINIGSKIVETVHVKEQI